MSARKMPPEFAVEVAVVAAVVDKAHADLGEANRRGLTGADCTLFLDAMDQASTRCEQLRREYFPRRHRLYVTGFSAAIFSKSGRCTEIVWRREPGDE
ncbi:hypothetical protein [Nocardia salmonicida]|uniref:hypothetical protein n=1 Tax=Nocardia salmonicida TaxID=53431 RepID=UPI0033DE3276